MLFSLLAASIDGFLCGFAAGTLDVEMKFKDAFLSFIIIFICCMCACVTGNVFIQPNLEKYLDITGVAVMFFLAYTAFNDSMAKIKPGSKIATISRSVAVDASIACMYMVMCGYNMFTVSFISAVLHCCLLYLGIKISHKIIKENILKYARYMRSAFFMTMALWKLVHI